MRQIRIIDAHTHFFCPEAAKDSSAWALARGEAYWAKLVGPRPDGKPTLQGFPDEKKFLSDMDEAGVERAVIQGWYWQNQQTCLEENARISKLVKAHPDRLSAFAAVNPACDGALEIAKSARSMGFCGLGEIHDGVQKFKYSSKAFEKLALEAQRQELAICLHITENTPRQYCGKTDTDTAGALQAAKDNAGTVFIFAHWCGNLAFENPQIFQDMPNAFFDTAATQFTAPKDAFGIASTIPQAKAKTIYGTDYPLRLYPRKFAREEMKTAADFAAETAPEYFAKNLFTINFTKAIKRP